MQRHLSSCARAAPVLTGGFGHLELEDASLLLRALTMPAKQAHQRLAVAVLQLKQLLVGPCTQGLHMCTDGLQQRARARCNACCVGQHSLLESCSDRHKQLSKMPALLQQQHMIQQQE
jgi:hypothetical protein